MRSHAFFSLFVVGAGVATALVAQEAPIVAEDLGQMNPEATANAFPGRGFSPYAGRNYPTQVLWGDQHVHTGWSGDAGAFGALLGPEEALRFARGEEVISSIGEPAKLSRPLDWVVITDHSDGSGMIFEVRDGNPMLMTDPVVRNWNYMMNNGQGGAAAGEIIVAQGNNALPDVVKDPKLAMTVWQKNTAFAEKYNDPGKFTALIGYEWTSSASAGELLPGNWTLTEAMTCCLLVSNELENRHVETQEP